MRKIPTLFVRDHDGDHLVRDEVTPGCEWVLRGEGIATRKWDGTCVMLNKDDLRWYKKFELKAGKQEPEGFIKSSDPDPVTGKTPGWVPVTEADKWYLEAIGRAPKLFWTTHNITFELIGPKINGNPEGVPHHMLIAHGNELYPGAPRTYEGLMLFFTVMSASELNIEGFVFHHPDGRMAKIKMKDFGLPRPKNLPEDYCPTPPRQDLPAAESHSCCPTLVGLGQETTPPLAPKPMPHDVGEMWAEAAKRLPPAPPGFENAILPGPVYHRKDGDPIEVPHGKGVVVVWPPPKPLDVLLESSVVPALVQEALDALVRQTPTLVQSPQTAPVYKQLQNPPLP